MALTNQADLAEKMALYRSHGITRDPKLMTHAPDGAWYYQQIALGYNDRMTELQAALGLSQMQRLDAFIARRRALAARYHRLLADLPITVPQQNEWGNSAWHLYVIRLKLTEIAPSRAAVFDALRAAGIGVNVHYIPIHTQPHYMAMGFAAGDYPEAERYYAEAISLPMFAALTDADQDRVVDVLKAVLI